jgi:hypothetical protein
MGKKERQFAKSQEWLDWLSDSTAAENGQKQPAQPQEVSQRVLNGHMPPRHQRQSLHRTPSATRPAVNSTSRSLGLDPSAFRPRAQPQPSQKVRSRPKKTPQQNTKAAPASDGTITLNFHLPTVRLPRFKINWRKVTLYGTIGVAVVALIFGAPFIIRTISHKSSEPTTTTSSDAPSFATILPSQAGGDYVEQSKKYDATKQVYYFKGQYKGVDVVGTEQALPDVFKAQKNKLKEQASAIGATEHIDVVGGDAYISPSDGNTSQRAVYASSQILVFVTYSGVMKDSEWVKFLQSFE